MALLQVSQDDRLPEKVKSIVAAFVGMMNKNVSSYEPPQANAYAFQTGGVVDLLKQLRDEFRGKLTECEKTEMNSQHAAHMIVQDLEAFVKNANIDIAEKTQEKLKKDTRNGEAKKELASTTEEKATNEKTLKDVKTECNEKRLSIQEKQQLRAEEIEAISKAIDILSSGDVLGSAEKYLSLAQGSKATALLQSSSGRSMGIHERRKIRDFLASESRRIHSKGLGLLAEKLAEDPFADVKKLIRGMIDRLTAEANEDAKNEGFCDKEVGMSEVTRKRLSEEVDDLTARIKGGEAKIIELTEEIATLTSDIATIDGDVEKAMAVRKAENKQNAQTVQDAKAAQKAVDLATKIIKDFYEKAATATAFVQAPPKKEWRLMGGAKMGSGDGDRSDQWKELANPNFEAEDSGHVEGMQTFGAVYKGRQAEAT